MSRWSFSFLFPFALLLGLSFAQAGKVMIFDEEKGIIFVEEGEAEKIRKKKKPPSGQAARPPAARPQSQGKSAEDLFQVGLGYYEADNYGEALHFFGEAYRRSKNPMHLFWAGRSQRQLEDFQGMTATFQRVLEDHPKSMVADDACFYLGAHWRVQGDFQKSRDFFQKLLTEYEDSHSISGKLDYRQEASTQLTHMREELTQMLGELGLESFNSMLGLKQFQQMQGIEETGLADSATYALLKQEADLARSAGEEKAQREEQARKRMELLSGIGGGFGLIGMGWLVWLGFRLRSMGELLQTVEDRMEDLKST